MALTQSQESLKNSLIATGETWNASFQNILKLDPDYLAAYIKLRSVPRNKQHLSIQAQELILLAMDAACTHLYEPGIRVHTAAALEAGATKEEIMETLELSSVLGVHAVTLGVPILLEVLEEEGRSLPQQELTAQQEELKAEFTQRRGYWSTSWDPVIRHSPEFFEGYLEFSSVPFAEGHRALDAKTKELIYTAIDCSTTHLFKQGLKVHIRNAIRYGATEQEIMEVFELATLMGVATTLKGADVLVDELEKRGEKV